MSNIYKTMKQNKDKFDDEFSDKAFDINPKYYHKQKYPSLQNKISTKSPYHKSNDSTKNDHIINPETGRKIRINGQKYKQLLKLGIINKKISTKLIQKHSQLPILPFRDIELPEGMSAHRQKFYKAIYDNNFDLVYEMLPETDVRERNRGLTIAIENEYTDIVKLLQKAGSKLKDAKAIHLPKLNVKISTDGIIELVGNLIPSKIESQLFDVDVE